MIDVFVLVATTIGAPCQRVWTAVADLRQRPSLISAEPTGGTWPEETATARVVMDKGTFRMARNERVVYQEREHRLMIKVEVLEPAGLAYLDYQLVPTEGGCRLSLSSLVAMPDPPSSTPEARAQYIAGTRQALEDTLAEYRRRIE
ncbi:MAG: SRPBCC family protein [Gemmatimonadales bacterium]|nr:SRPBCC family protein [Gemmatimonadales bacterium]